MLATQLILIEGLPGSGKSTTASYLGQFLQNSSIPCNWYLEDDHPHPIPCLDLEIKGLSQKMIPLWQEFAQRAAREPGMTVLESRLWQNTALYMLMSEVNLAEIVDFNLQAGVALSPLSPALIYLDQPDVAAALRRMASTRGKAWVDAALRETLDYPWFASRGIHDFEGWLTFFVAWHEVAERLFHDWPHPKTRILDPQEDWAEAYKKMSGFLQFDSRLDSSARGRSMNPG